MHRHVTPGPRPLLALSLAAALLGGAACRTGSPQDGAQGGPDSVPPPAGPAGRSAVLPGLEVLLRDSMHLVRGKRVGLITNQTALTSRGEHAVDVLARAPGVNLVALYGPEHGVRGNIEGGTKIENQRDSATGVPVFSLYGRTQKPTAEMLRGVDVLLFDIQDIGARPYTFVWTMAMAMEAAAAQRIPFVVLDRPNPITAAVDGPLMLPEIKRDTVGQPITGYYPVPLRHGMTVGEVARYVNGEYGVGAELHVVPADGWEGGAWFDEGGLPWINPSPNIRSLDAALKYSGLVLSEATNLTVGRGTDAPFSYLGAPWMDAPAVLARVRAYGLQGVRLDTVRFVPSSPDTNAWVPFRGEPVRAVRLTVTDREAFDPPYAALVLLTEIKRLHPAQFRITNEGFTQMIGSYWARQAFDRGEDPRGIQRRWEQEVQAWMRVRDRYRIYPR
ncbi:MAG TPA: DUF1343 domain-containing protein [Longimicrobiaceae bacterium]|nr:DUF1343 domain-containing protein [Longimicrobiaceae bacterium]